MLAACNPAFPQQDLVVRILIGSGVRISELCGIAVEGQDGLPDLMLDSVDRGRVELRVRWDGGAKGKKSRRVAITPKLAAAIKRYQARPRWAWRGMPSSRSWGDWPGPGCCQLLQPTTSHPRSTRSVSA